jgi:hypothetical protein
MLPLIGRVFRCWHIPVAPFFLSLWLVSGYCWCIREPVTAGLVTQQYWPSWSCWHVLTYVETAQLCHAPDHTAMLRPSGGAEAEALQG